MRRKVIPDHVAVLYHESNPLQFRDVGDRVSTDGDEVCKFPGSTEPMRSCQPSISAAFVVMARITSRGDIPASRKLTMVATLFCPRVFPG